MAAIVAGQRREGTMRRSRRNKNLAAIVDEGALLSSHHGRYEAALFLLLHRVRFGMILRILGPLARRRAVRVQR